MIQWEGVFSSQKMKPAPPGSLQSKNLFPPHRLWHKRWAGNLLLASKYLWRQGLGLFSEDEASVDKCNNPVTTDHTCHYSHSCFQMLLTKVQVWQWWWALYYPLSNHLQSLILIWFILFEVIDIYDHWPSIYQIWQGCTSPSQRKLRSEWCTKNEECFLLRIGRAPTHPL